MYVLCMFYLYFCKETWLSVNSHILKKAVLFPNVNKEHIGNLHLVRTSMGYFFPFYGRQYSNIGTVIIWLRVIVFLGLKWMALWKLSSLISPISLNDATETDNLGPAFPCQWVEGLTQAVWLQGSFPLHLSYFSKRLESVPPCLSVWHPGSRVPEKSRFLLNWSYNHL